MQNFSLKQQISRTLVLERPPTMLAKINWEPTRKEVRNFGLLMFVLLPLFGSLMAWRFDSRTPLIVCASLGVAVERPELFIGDDSSAKTKLFRELLSGTASTLRVHPRFKGPVGASLAATVGDSSNLATHLTELLSAG